jgi:hypothetical protein
MTLADTVPVLSVHYSPGVLAVLRREPCPGRLSGWNTTPGHGPTCGCYGARHKFVVVKVSGLRPGEESWCLERSWIPREAVV